MKRGWLALIFGAAILAVGILAVYFAAPRVDEIDPPPNTNDASGSAAIRLRFSRLMDEASVSERLEINPSRLGKIAWENGSLVFTPDQPWKGGETVHVRLAKGASTRHFPKLRIATDAEWTFQVRNPVLLYLYPPTTPASLYIINPNSKDITPLYADKEEVLDYSLTPDGKGIIFSIRQGNTSTLYRLDPENGQAVLIRRFENGLVRSAQLSPSAEYYAYEFIDFSESTVKAHVWLLPNDGKPDAHAVRLPDAGGSAQQPAWSSQNILAYYDAAAQLYRFYDPARGTEIASVTCQTGEKGAWAGNGQSYLFPEILPDESTNMPASHLLRFHLSSGELEYLTQKKNAEDTSPAFSPDNHWLVFARKFLDPLQWTPGRQIWMMNLDTGETYPLLQEAQYHHYSFAWSPDSAQMAYLRFNQMSPTEPPELWVINADGTQPRQLVIGGYAPQWLP